jgi:hypothetical protein
MGRRMTVGASDMDAPYPAEPLAHAPDSDLVHREGVRGRGA